MKDYSDDDLARSSARSRVADLIQRAPLIQGSLVESERTCGTATCRCHGKGPRHPATYLAVRQDGKRSMICVPERLTGYVKECIDNYRKLQRDLEVISRDCLENFTLKKKKVKK